MTKLSQFRKESFSKDFMNSVIDKVFERFKSNFTMSMQENFFMRSLDFKFLYKDGLIGIMSESIDFYHNEGLQELFDNTVMHYCSMIESYFDLAMRKMEIRNDNT